MNPDSDNIYSKRTNNLDFLFWSGEKVMRRDRHHVRPDCHHVRPFLSYLVAKNVFLSLPYYYVTFLICLEKRNKIATIRMEKC